MIGKRNCIIINSRDQLDYFTLPLSTSDKALTYVITRLMIELVKNMTKNCDSRSQQM